jgi:hypothetical protein
MSRPPARWPVWVALALLALACAYVLADFARRTDASRVIYCLDDAYIHMAIAKNLATHGVFGVTPFEFSFASSSPLWIALLWLAFAAFGAAEIVPLLVNVALAGALLIVVARLLQARGARPWVECVVLALVIFHTPLIPNVFSGMEHCLHILLSLLFATAAATFLSRPETPRAYALLLVLAPALATVRYEGLFLVAVVSALGALRGDMRRAALLAAAAALPLVILGSWSVAQGGSFLPTPVLLKGSRPFLDGWPGVAAFARRGLEQLVENRWIGRLVVVCFVLWILRFRTKRAWEFAQVLLLAFVCTAFLHAQFAAWGWYYRYEAYLVAMAILALAIALLDTGRVFPAAWASTRRARLIALLAGVGVIVYLGDGLLGRCYDAVHRTPKAMKNIYEQQYQMGRFLMRHYAGMGVYANDVGAIDFLADLRTVDLVGLASTDVARARIRGEADAQIRALVSRPDRGSIAVVYEKRFGSFFSEQDWIEVGRWTISDNVVCDAPTVTWLARDTIAARELSANLGRFEPELPRDVESSVPR